ncbi:MAG: trypsin-like peptidase domain-containing protein [Cyanobacteria bacterium J06639_16]
MTRARLTKLIMFCLGLAIALWWGERALMSPSAYAQAEEPAVVRSLSLAELPTLGIASEMPALIPPSLRQSNHPQNRRGIIDGDERVEMLSRSYPWSAIGLIISYSDSDSAQSCSGTLVATDVVLTNAHCVLDYETGEVYPSIVFAPNVINGTVVSTDDITEVDSVFYGPAFAEDPRAPHPDDWAFMKLKQPLGDRYGTLPWQIIPPERLVNDYEGEINLVGYSGDFPEDNPGKTAGVHLGCSVIDQYEDSLAHDCDTFGGSSGGPLLMWIDDQPYIVGVNSAEWVRPVDDSDSPEWIGVVNFGVQIPRIADFLETYL